MAEIAFETIVRVVIAIAVLSLLLSLLSILQEKAEQSISKEFKQSELIIDGSDISVKGLKALITACYEQNKRNVDGEVVCAIVRDVNTSKLKAAANSLNFTYVESINKNVIISFLPNGSVKIG